MPFVYLVQPEILLGTKRYKLGMSLRENYNRIKEYGKDTKIIKIFHCNNPRKIEIELIKNFNEKYDCVSGLEYFDINNEDEINMIELFEEICKNVNDNIETKFDFIKIIEKLKQSKVKFPVSHDLLYDFKILTKQINKNNNNNTEDINGINSMLKEGIIKYQERVDYIKVKSNQSIYKENIDYIKNNKNNKNNKNRLTTIYFSLKTFLKIIIRYRKNDIYADYIIDEYLKI
jgi:hypothetical protein